MSETHNRAMLVILATALAVATSYLFFPGLMSFDSIFQYRQVIGDLPVRNYHPPVMVYAWQLGHHLFGPGSMLVFHQMMYWCAIAVIAVCVRESLWGRSLVVVILGLLPPLWIHSATVWNDVGVMCAFLLAVACTLLLKRTGARWVFIVGLLALCYGLAAKRTALLAAIPLFYILCDAYFNSGGRRGHWSNTAMLASMLLLSGLLAGLMMSSIGVEKYTKWPTIAVWDLTAVSIAEQKVLIPTTILFDKDEPEAATLARMEAAFDPEVNGTLGDIGNFFPEPEHLREEFNAWLSLPLDYPVSYFKHRARVFARLLGLGPNKVRMAFEDRIIANDFGLQLLNKDSKALGTAFEWVALSTNTLIYRPWLYLVILVVTLSLASYRLWRNNTFGSRFLVCMGFSGLLYVSPLFIVAPATDFRYTLWMVACSAIMLCVILRSPANKPH